MSAIPYPKVSPLAQTPRHVAIIMDGNGRWALERGLPRVEGHRQGAKAVNRVVTACREMGVEVLTLYAFSEQNWGRPDQEVGLLMQLLHDYVRQERMEILGNGIRLTTIGDTSRLPVFVRIPLDALVAESAKNKGMRLVLALSYGGREELVDAVKAIARRVASGELIPEHVDQDTVADALHTSDWEDPELVIRTSGELRLSNFLLWQSAYAELYFTDTYWPDFDRESLEAAFVQFAKRKRRFGLTDQQVAEPLEQRH